MSNISSAWPPSASTGELHYQQARGFSCAGNVISHSSVFKGVHAPLKGADRQLQESIDSLVKSLDAPEEARPDPRGEVYATQVSSDDSRCHSCKNLYFSTQQWIGTSERKEITAMSKAEDFAAAGREICSMLLKMIDDLQLVQNLQHRMDEKNTCEKTVHKRPVGTATRKPEIRHASIVRDRSGIDITINLSGENTDRREFSAGLMCHDPVTTTIAADQQPVYTCALRHGRRRLLSLTLATTSSQSLPQPSKHTPHQLLHRPNLAMIPRRPLK